MNFYTKLIDSRDAYHVYDLRNDPAVICQLHDIRRYSITQCKQWIESLANNEKSKRIVINHEKDSRFIGLFRIDNIDYINNHCSVGLDITKKERGKGYSKHIYKQIIGELFNHFNMNLVWLEVLETNEIAINLYKSLGFQTDGILRERILRNGVYINSIVMSLKKDNLI